MAELNLSPHESDQVLKRIRKTLKRLKARRMDTPNPFTLFWGYSEATLSFAGYTLKIVNDNWTGITLYGDDDAIEVFMDIFDAIQT